MVDAAFVGPFRTRVDPAPETAGMSDGLGADIAFTITPLGRSRRAPHEVHQTDID